MKLTEYDHLKEFKTRAFARELRVNEWTNDRDWILSVRTPTNDIKCEIKYTPKWGLHYVIGYKSGRPDADRIEHLESAFRHYSLLKHHTRGIFAHYIDHETFWHMVDIADSITEIRPTYRKKSSKWSWDGLMIIFRAAYDQGMLGEIRRASLDNREINEFVTLNDKTEKNNYREHIVPIDLIIREIINMFEDGCSNAEIAQMIKANLAIVHIPSADAKRLDTELGLKTTMPEGWEFGDCVFARLDEAGINY